MIYDKISKPYVGIKNGTIKRTKYDSLEQMNIDLMNFLVHFITYTESDGSLRRELKVKTPFNAIEKWYELDSEIFKEKTEDFKNKILNLKIIKTSCEQQLCET